MTFAAAKCHMSFIGEALLDYIYHRGGKDKNYTMDQIYLISLVRELSVV